MAKGSSVIGVRVSNELRAEIEAAVASANAVRQEEPYTLSAWVLAAIRERLDWLERAKRSAEKRKRAKKGGA